MRNWNSFQSGEAGLTLVEVLVAIGILMIGLVAVMQFFPVGIQGMETGRQQSTAVFLAEQRVEQIKAWALSAAAGQGFLTITAGNPSAAACCSAEGYGAIQNYPGYRRQVVVTDASATTKVVQVQVFYQPVMAVGVLTTERQVELAVLLASR